ncbi:hypothetical protein EJB05_27102, partial [Eragrostis curvula]
MDRVVRIFYGGTVNKDGEMVDMRDQVVPFVKAPMFSEIETKAASFVGVRGGLRFRGRFDAGGGGRAHYVLLELGTEDMWLLYKECLKDAQVKIAEVIVDVVGRDGCAAIVPETVMLEDEPADVLTQEGLHVPECHDGSPVGEHVHPLVSPRGMVEYNDIPDNTFEEEDRGREEENNMAPDLRYRLLDTTFDEEHRAHLMVDLGRQLKCMRSRTHKPLSWDERYAVYIGRAGLLPLARLVNAGLPRMDSAALTALVDRWRPETHTFHLPCGELTVTLQDVAMILGLPIVGLAMIGMVQPQGWRDMVEAALGLRPPEVEEDVKDRKTTGVSSAWLAEHFSNLEDPEAPDWLVERYARAWLWHLIGGFLFPDGSGNTISWMVFPIVAGTWENMATYSWGSGVLAYLYRQLCDGCRRSGQSSGLGGCLYLLQVWMWERLPVARPDRIPVEEWQFDDDGSLPTVGYLWKNCINVVGNKERRYLFYMNELDCLTQHQVEWTPYHRPEVMQMQLSPLCYRDKEFWRIEVPLIFYYAVEWHLPQRVMRQFDRLQITNVPFTLTNKILHKCNRKKERGAVNWAEKNQAYIALWENRVNIRVQPTSGPRHLTVAFNEYLQWFHEVSRVHLKPALSGVAIADLPDSGDEDDLIDDYDAATRVGTQPERAPLHNYTATQMGRLDNEAAHALRHPQGSAEEL